MSQESCGANPPQHSQLKTHDYSFFIQYREYSSRNVRVSNERIRSKKRIPSRWSVSC